jgi:hypothetical protein
LAVFFSQKMIDSLKRRKEMYIMRDKHLDQFLAPTIKETVIDYDKMDEDEQSVYENGASIGNFALVRADVLELQKINILLFIRSFGNREY